MKDEMAAKPYRHSRRFWIGWGVALGASALVVVLATLPPFVGSQTRVVLMQGFSAMCHQLADRSPSLGGVQLAVCHRCYGIYWGLPLAVLGYLALTRWDRALSRYAPFILTVSLLPAGIDWVMGVLGVWHNTPVSRVITGAFFGLVAGYYFARALTEAFRGKHPETPHGTSDDPAVFVPSEAHRA